MPEYIENLLKLRKFFKLGTDLIRQGKTISEIVHGDIDSDDPEEPPRSFDDLVPIESASVLLGCACALEDVIREIPKGTVKKAKKKVFHTDKLELDDDE